MLIFFCVFFACGYAVRSKSVFSYARLNFHVWGGVERRNILHTYLHSHVLARVLVEVFFDLLKAVWFTSISALVVVMLLRKTMATCGLQRPL